MPGHPLQSPAQFLLPQAQQGQQGESTHAGTRTFCFFQNKLNASIKVFLSSHSRLGCNCSVSSTGLLTTPNLISLPQQNQGSLLSAPNRMALQAQVEININSSQLELILQVMFFFFNSCCFNLLQRDKSAEVGSGGMTAVPSVASHPEEPNDLEELEQFARTFKQRRIKLGFTQVWQTHTWGASVNRVSTLIIFASLSLSSGRRGPGHGKTVRQRFQPDHHLPLRSPQPEL